MGFSSSVSLSHFSAPASAAAASRPAAPPVTASLNWRTPHRKIPQTASSDKFLLVCSSSSESSSRVLHKSVPFAATLAIILWSNPANAGFLSGFSGIESVPGPQLPSFDFLNRFNEKNQKKYAENDERFKSSPLLKQLLEQSKSNKEKNRQEILDKYCIRGAEWGVGDCSAAGMSIQDRDKFIDMLKQKAGVKD